MKLRLSLLAAVVFAMALALAGVLNEVNSTRAGMPLPVQPFSPLSKGGISNNQLGTSIAQNFTITEAEAGERVTLPWIFSGSGFSSDLDGAITNGTIVGTVWSELDVDCNGSLDHLYKGPACDGTPLDWFERTTAVETSGEGYLRGIMPPNATFPWLLRHRADITHVCTPGGIGSPSVLNTVYSQVSFSRPIGGNKAFVAQTQLGGSASTPPSKVCLDSPQSSESITNVYNNPPKANADTNSNGLDDASGIYARWTIFQSRGSSSLMRESDLRKTYESPPSFPSDTGFVERTLQLECFWIDGDGCDPATECHIDGNNSFITPEESMLDGDLLAKGGRDHFDADHDCLMNSNAEPAFVAAGAIDTDDSLNVAYCPAVPWSLDGPVYDTAADQDCDGLVDGVEWSYGSLYRDVDDNDNDASDSDEDGSPDFMEMFLFTNPNIADTDADGHLDKPASVYLNDGTGKTIGGALVPSDPNVDNCPAVSNPGQENFDAGRRPTGTQISGVTATSNPNQDKFGDVCDWDDDNDGATDEYENVTSLTDDQNIDSDGDTVIDSAEIRLQLGGDPTADPNNASLKPGWSAEQAKYFRGCMIHVNIGDHPTYTEQDGLQDGVEMNVDGDTLNCAMTGATDSDSDNGGLGHPTKVELSDQIEAYGYFLSITSPDTDGDGCDDWFELMDINGDRQLTGNDSLREAKAVNGVPVPITNAVSLDIYDVNQDGVLTGSDLLTLNKNTCTFKDWGGCPDGCTAEN